MTVLDFCFVFHRSIPVLMGNRINGSESMIETMGNINGHMPARKEVPDKLSDSFCSGNVSKFSIECRPSVFRVFGRGKHSLDLNLVNSSFRHFHFTV